MIARRETIEHAIARTERNLAELELLAINKAPAGSNHNVTPTWMAQFEREILKKLKGVYSGAKR